MCQNLTFQIEDGPNMNTHTAVRPLDVYCQTFVSAILASHGLTD